MKVIQLTGISSFNKKNKRKNFFKLNKLKIYKEIHFKKHNFIRALLIQEKPEH